MAVRRVASYDLQYAGFLVFQVNHRLAPPGHLTGQHTSGIAPAQTDDAERQILAALADPQCNGTIYLVGGSAGGCLALYCALDSATHAATGWSNDARVHIKAVISLSGPTNLDDWSHPDVVDYEQFETAADNYVGQTYPRPHTRALARRFSGKLDNHWRGDKQPASYVGRQPER